MTNDLQILSILTDKAIIQKENTQELSNATCELTSMSQNEAYDFDLKLNTYINYTSGQEISLEDYVATDYISLDENCDVMIKTYLSEDNAGYAFYNTSNKYVGGWNISSYNGKYKQIQVPSEAKYLRVSCKSENKNDLKVYKTNVKDSNFYDQDYTEYHLISGYYITNNGTLISSPNHYVTDYVKIDTSKKIYVNALLEGDAATIVFYNINKSRVAYLTAPKITQVLTEIKIPSTVNKNVIKFMRVSTQKNGVANFQIRREGFISQLTQNIQDVTQISQSLGGYKYNLIFGKFINYSNGTEVSHNYTYYTDYIDITDKFTTPRTISLRARFKNDGAGYAFYTQDKTYISGKTLSSDANEFITIKVPENAVYFRSSCYSEGYNNFAVVPSSTVVKNYNDIEDLSSHVNIQNTIQEFLIQEDLGKSFSCNFEPYSYLGYCDNTGTIQPSSASLYAYRRRTDYLALSDYNTFKVASGKEVAFWTRVFDENKGWLGTIGGSSAVASTETITYTKVKEEYPTAGYVMLVSKKTSGTTAMSAETIGLEVYRNEVNNLSGICIGDSLTQGLYYKEDGSSVITKDTYPKYLSEKTGIPFINAGVAGYSPSDWWINLSSKYDFSQCGACIIWLGTNYAPYTHVSDDYDFSTHSMIQSTQTAYYCKIIDNIIMSHPNIKIFICNIFDSKTITDKLATRVQINSIIQEISEQSSISANIYGIIETVPLATGTGSMLHPYNYAHFGRLGNMYVASDFYSQIKKLMYKNYKKLEYIS